MATALRFGTEVGGIAEHFGKRNKRVHLGGAVGAFHALDHAAAGIEVEMCIRDSFCTGYGSCTSTLPESSERSAIVAPRIE